MSPLEDRIDRDQFDKPEFEPLAATDFPTRIKCKRRPPTILRYSCPVCRLRIERPPKPSPATVEGSISGRRIQGQVRGNLERTFSRQVKGPPKRPFPLVVTLSTVGVAA